MAVNKPKDSDKKTGAVMVVGGGISGIQAALDLAETGFYVYLVEKKPAIGGVMQEVRAAIATVLERVTVADLCERVRKLRGESAAGVDYII